MKKSTFLIVFFLILFGLYYGFGKRGDTLQTETLKNYEIMDWDLVASGLKVPWEIAFLPDGRMLVTERPGTLKLIGSDTSHKVEKVFHVGEGGLLGLTVDPDFSRNRYIYLYYTYNDPVGLTNRVSRFRLEEDSLGEEKAILDGIKGYRFHDGGRIKFGPDGKLYVTTGDAGETSLAQNLNSPNGKILRVNPDGSVPSDNPFSNSYVYSYGHRNPQGISWDHLGNLWATEHGPDARDEINLIIPGKNYGWPIVTGDTTGVDIQTPKLHSGEGTWAPSGSEMVGNKLYFTGLAGRALYVYDLSSGELETLMEGEFGRLRTVMRGPDGSLYLLTSNLDGRNSDPDPEDDRIIRLNLKESD
jgi:glucose/arabinose dehydrogenase